jgi:hypothetical protein
MRTLLLPVCLASLVLSSTSLAQRAVDASSSPTAAIEKAFADLTAVRDEMKPLQEKLRDKELSDEERTSVT